MNWRRRELTSFSELIEPPTVTGPFVEGATVETESQ